MGGRKSRDLETRLSRDHTHSSFTTCSSRDYVSSLQVLTLPPRLNPAARLRSRTSFGEGGLRFGGKWRCHVFRGDNGTFQRWGEVWKENGSMFLLSKQKMKWLEQNRS